MTGRSIGSRLRVLQLTHRMGIGGLERVVETLCRTIDRDRFEVAVLCLRDTGLFALPLQELGIQVERIRADPDRTEHLAFLKVARFMRAWRPDVLHTHNTEPFLDGTLAALMTGVRTHVHTDHARAFPDKTRYLVAERIAAIFAYRVVGVSEDATRNLRRYVRIPAKKLMTIENGVDGAPFELEFDRAAARRSLGVDPDAPLIGLVARLEDQKGINFLLDAMPAVFGTFPDCTLLIAGTGSRSGSLRQQAEELGLGDRVRFLGPWTEVPRLLRSLDLFLLPSVWEGLPMALLEAMAAACPILASTAGGTPAAIRHGESGWLVPPSNSRAIADGVLHLLSRPRLRDQLALEARRTFTERYSAAAMSRRYESLYLRQPFSPEAPPTGELRG